MTDHTEGLPHLQFSAEALKVGPGMTLAIVGDNVVRFYGVEGKGANHYVFFALKEGVAVSDTPLFRDLEQLGQRSNVDCMTFPQLASELPDDIGIYCCIGLPLLEADSDEPSPGTVTEQTRTRNDTDDRTYQQVVLKDISDTPVLPVLTEGALAGCFLVDAADVSVPSPRLPKIVRDTWDWQGGDARVTLNNLWFAVEATWVRSRMADQGIRMTEAIFDIFTLCGLSVVGERKGLNKSLRRAVEKGAYVTAQMLHHDGTGFEAGDHVAVLLIRQNGKTDKPLLSIVGSPEEHFVFDLGVDAAPDPLATILAFPPKK